jgi:hypothetical protein
MKMLLNYVNFPESFWCFQAQFLLVKRIQKVSSAVIKEFLKAASDHIKRISKVSSAIIKESPKAASDHIKGFPKVSNAGKIFQISS